MSTRLNILLTLSAALLVTMVASLHLGMRLYAPGEVWAALSGRDTGTDALIVTTLRVPRTLIAVVGGAALGLSGLLMQAASRNPLAEPGLLGVNAGAALSVVIWVTLFGLTSMAAIAISAGLGALLAISLVLGLTALGDVRADPTSILLVGVTLAALFGAMVQVILLSNETALETLLFWLAGSFADRDPRLLWVGLPMLLAGVAVTLWLAPSLDRSGCDGAGYSGLAECRPKGRAGNARGRLYADPEEAGPAGRQGYGAHFRRQNERHGQRHHRLACHPRKRGRRPAWAGAHGRHHLA